MSTRRIYRLEIWYPEKMPKDPDDGWDELPRCWPRERHYLSQSGATKRAQWLRSHGCEVLVVQSKPVEWENTSALEQARVRATRERRRIEKLRAML